MRSHELAALADVSIRTLRHYHQIGLLDEPERSANGYRRYTVQHLAAMLRIARFTDLGIPLSEVHRVLDDPEATAALLQVLDAQAAAEIDRLERRRARLAALASGAPPDLPTALIPFAALLLPPVSVSQSRFEREQLALVEHLSDDPSLSWLVAASEHLSRSGRYPPLMVRLHELPPDAPHATIAQLVEELAAELATVPTVDDTPAFHPQFNDLLLAHQRAHFNAAQRIATEMLVARLVQTERSPHELTGP